jgi:two-component system LytT family sensor kinase
VEKSIEYSVVIRLLISALFALVFVVLDTPLPLQGPLLFLMSFVTIYIFWEFHYKALKLCYQKVEIQKTVFQAVFLVAVSVMVFFLVLSTINVMFEVYAHQKSLFLLFLIVSIITVFHVLLMSVRQLFYHKHQQFKGKSLVLEEKYKSIKSKTILHFLQNSLQATQKLITLEPEKADLQIEALTTMLRSLLQSRDRDYISLKEESDLVKEFVKLLELQGNVKIIFSIEDEPEHQDYQIPPFVLILIFDNIFLNRSFIPFAELQVYVENGIYLVAKYRQLRKGSFLQKQEELLKNLKQRYSFTKQDTNVVMISTQTHTYIKVPLLKPE